MSLQAHFHMQHSPIDGPVEGERRDRMEATTEGPGDKSKLWRLLGHEAADQYSFRFPGMVNRITPMVGNAVADGEWSRAMFGNLAFLLPFAGAVLGVFAVINTNGWAMPCTLPLFAAILCLGILDASAGLAAFITFGAGVVLSGHLNGVHPFVTLFAIAVVWYAGPQIPHKLRPIQRYPMMQGFDRFWRIGGDWVIDFLLVGFITASMVELMQLFTGMLVPIAEQYKQFWWISIGAMAVRLGLQSMAMYYFPRRLVAVRHAGGPRRNRFLTLVFAGVVQAVICVASLYVVMGWRWQLWAIAILYMLMIGVEQLEWDFPEAKWIRRFIPISLTRILLAVIVGQLAASYFINHGVHDGRSLTAGIFLTVAVLLLVLTVFGKFKGESWPQHPVWRFFGFCVVAFLGAFALGVIQLY